MGIYGSAISKYTKKIFSDQEIEDLNSTLFEIYSDLIESYESQDDLETIDEGANLEMRANFKDSKKECKQHIKSYKKYLKDKDYKKASKELEYVLKELKSSKEKIKNIDADSTSTTIIGFLVGFLISILEPFIHCSASTLIGFTAGEILAGETFKKAINYAAPYSALTYTIYFLISTVRDLKTFKEEIQSDYEKDSISNKNFNLYRNKLLRYIDDSIKNIEKIKARLNELKIESAENK